MSLAATAHGMSKMRVKPDWAPLGLEEVRALLQQYEGCGEPVEMVSVSPRPFSAASVVRTCDRSVFIKRHHHSVRDREGALEEHRFLTHLHENGGAVSRVLETGAGETAIELGAWTYEVHACGGGVDIYADALSWTPFFSAAHAHSAGSMLARLHQAAEGFHAPPRKARPLVASFSIFAEENAALGMERYLGERPALAGDALTRHCCDEALDLLTPFHGRLKPHLSALQPLWTHNDLHASNLLWRGEEAETIIDFGLADRSNAMHDLAHAIERNIVEWLELDADSARIDNVPVHLDHLNELLDGYASQRPLSHAEAQSLAPMTALCHAEFALTEADYFLGVLRSEENARLCVEDYLLGHARWYRGPGGKKLLDAIDRWAEGHLKRRRDEAE
jgi:Ser/Thr protein kinase RdoA (MazF antagonist)